MFARNACYRVAASIKSEIRGEVKGCYFRERGKAIELQTVYQRVRKMNAGVLRSCSKDSNE
jgi:hypothetical protein